MFILAPFPYSQLYCSNCMFSTDGQFKLYEEALVPFRMQFTLIIHRVNLPGETPNNAIQPSVSGYNAGSYILPSPNTLSAGTGQVLQFLGGFLGGKLIQLPSTTCSIDLTFTGVSTVTLSVAGYRNSAIFAYLAFYLTDCDASCETCSGPLPTQCLSCKQLSYRIRLPDANTQCPCLQGFYENAGGICTPCPSEQNCATCQF
jgi:hypothetical protein